jgi:hypothetical protein
LGDAFELSLTRAFNELKENTANNISSVLRTGANLIPRGVQRDLKIKYEIDIKDKDKKKPYWDEAIMKKVGENWEVEYDPGEEKQGKTDIIVTFKGNNPPAYRISAKRWSSGAGSFGSTSIDAGLFRAGGLKISEAYKKAVYWEGETVA